ncbi:MAG: UDP-N-acetylmuramoyl-L-alanyl-D-glutamate--2,6-diaminopimelate ligase [Pseudomonadota bacterium]
MRLADLLTTAGFPLAQPLGQEAAAREITLITQDSRTAGPGSLFAALPGSRFDGRSFIPEVLAKGTDVVLAPSGTQLPEGSQATLLASDAPRHWLARLAAVFLAPQPRLLVCVTGTSGKTSVAHFTRGLWSSLGQRAASLGTLGVQPAVVPPLPGLTTADPVALHGCLSDLQAAGYEQVVLEASSHGLDQHRLDGLDVAAAAFTNLSHEHLDYHGDMASYFAAKARLFADLLRPDGVAVLNADSPYYEELTVIARRRGQRILSFGNSGAANLRLLAQTPVAKGQTLDLSIDGKEQRLLLPLIGDFQASNALAALGLVIGTGADPDAALAGVTRLTPVPGRLEYVGQTAQGGRVYVDYAHKPAALEAVLTTLRPHTKGRLSVVVGCGGDRDREKRPVMGRMAAELADRGIITDDNPRSEDPARIRAAMLAGNPSLTEIGDREEAIAAAIADLRANDVLVIAGKGHESGQTAGGVTLPFDDREVARRYLAMENGDEGGKAA